MPTNNHNHDMIRTFFSASSQRAFVINKQLINMLHILDQFPQKESGHNQDICWPWKQLTEPKQQSAKIPYYRKGPLPHRIA